MSHISINSAWSLVLDGRHLTIDKPGTSRKDVQVITTISDMTVRYPSSLRITTKGIAEAMHIRTFMTVAPPATITTGPFSFEFFPHEDGDGFNFLINNVFFYFTQTQVDFIPFDKPITLLVSAERKPTVSNIEDLKFITGMTVVTRIVISGREAELWHALLPQELPLQITIPHNQTTLPF